MAAVKDEPLRRPRQDQVRNRARLLSAARAVLKRDGLEASIEAIARQAGVGPTTFYRHFPTKEALLMALLDDLAGAAREVAAGAAEHPDSWEAFAVLFTEGCALDPEDLALYDLIGRAGDRFARRGREQTAEIIGPAVLRAQADGCLRGDVAVEDVAALMRMADEAPGAGRARYVRVLLDGLRTARHGAA